MPLLLLAVTPNHPVDQLDVLPHPTSAWSDPHLTLCLAIKYYNRILSVSCVPDVDRFVYFSPPRVKVCGAVAAQQTPDMAAHGPVDPDFHTKSQLYH